MEKVTRVAIGCFLAFFVSLSHLVSAGVFWKTVPVEGPRAPNVGLVLGNESRTLAFGASGVYEFDGFGWHRIRVYTDLGAETTLPGQPFFRAGRFFALDRTDRTRTRLLRLEGDTWKKLFESGPMDTFAMGATRLYFARGGFDAFCRSTVCSDPYSEGIRMISVALGDGTIREEAKSPACTGELYAAGDVLYLQGAVRGVRGPQCTDAALQGRRIRRCLDSSLPAGRRPLDAASATRRVGLRAVHDRARSLDDLIGVPG